MLAHAIARKQTKAAPQRADVSARTSATPAAQRSGLADETRARPSWDFADLPLFAPERTTGAPATALPPMPLQAKLVVGPVDDPLEREADRAADRVMRMAAPAPIAQPSPPQLSRKCEACEEEDTQKLQKKSAGGLQPQTVPPIVHEVLRSPGRPLDAPTRAFMEPRFGYGFGSVRVHADTQAAQSARAVNALAYAVGHDVVFGAGRFAPDTSVGLSLLAHELAHTVQQGAVKSQQPSAALSRADGQRLQRQELIPLPEGPIEPFEIPPDFDFDPEIEAEGEGETELDPESELDPDAEVQPDSDLDPETQPDLDPQPQPGTQPQPQPGPVPEPFVGPVPQPQQQPPEEEPEKDPKCGSATLPATVVTFAPGPIGQGGTVTAEPLTKCPGNTVGSLPSPQIYKDQFRCIAMAGQTANWLRAHLLHGRTTRPGSVFNLHGPGNDMRNLIITDKSLNGSMNRGAEIPAINRVWGNNEVLWYESRVNSYVPGLDAFAQSITVNFGSWNPATKSRGPRLGGGTFPISRTPPHCPTVASTPGIVPPVPNPPAPKGGSVPGFLFQSTVDFCFEFPSREIEVTDGGLEVRISVHRAPGPPAVPQSGGPPPCASKEYLVVLEESALIGWDEKHVSPLKIGQTFRLRWSHLPKDTYRLRFVSLDRDPNCCLKGDIFVGKFSAPRPPRSFRKLPTA